MTVKSRFTIAFITVFTIVVMLLAWSGNVLYTMQHLYVKTEIEYAIKTVAEELQNENVSNLNNLTAFIDDKDLQSKMAFAAGITGNKGKIKTWFNNNEQISRGKTEQQERISGKKVLQINHEFLSSKNLQYQPQYDLGINVFDSIFSKRIKDKKLKIAYRIYEQSPNDNFSDDQNYQFSSPLFILSFYNPIVYHVDYSINRSTVLLGMRIYFIICTLLLSLLLAAFLFIRRAYNLKVEMTEFRESLFSNVTHELKTPISSLQIIIENASPYQPLSSEHLSYAKKELERIKQLTDKILSFGKMDKDQFELNKEMLNLEEVVKNAIAIIQTQAKQYNALIQYTGSDNLYVAGDKTLLTNTIVTLIDNALKYNKKTPEIYITLQKEADAMVLKVKDNGIGIAPEYYKHIFKPFFRIPTGDMHDIKGHGLGLSIALQVIKLHRGSITINSNYQGSVFTIVFFNYT